MWRGSGPDRPVTCVYGTRWCLDRSSLSPGCRVDHGAPPSPIQSNPIQSDRAGTQGREAAAAGHARASNICLARWGRCAATCAGVSASATRGLGRGRRCLVPSAPPAESCAGVGWGGVAVSICHPHPPARGLVARRAVLLGRGNGSSSYVNLTYVPAQACDFNQRFPRYYYGLFSSEIFYKIDTVAFSFVFGSCLVLQKFCKIFQIPRHIKSLDVCMEY